jgi:hypothetical protein
MRREVLDIVEIYCPNSPLDPFIIKLILELAGVLFVGRKSICWVEFIDFSRPRRYKNVRH